jgi:hypothetical protein
MQQSKGIRERLILESPAPGVPFDHGKFAIIEEPVKMPWPQDDPLHFSQDRIHWTKPQTPAATIKALPVLP